MAYRDPAVGRARDLERYHRRTAARQAAGLCPRCGKRPPVPERSLCEPCAEKHRIPGRVSDAKRRGARQQAPQQKPREGACLRAPPIQAEDCGAACGRALSCLWQSIAGARAPAVRRMRREEACRRSAALRRGQGVRRPLRRQGRRAPPPQRARPGASSATTPGARRAFASAAESARPQTAAPRARNAASHATATSAPGGMPGAPRDSADRAAIPRRTARPAARAAPCCRRAGRRAESTPGRCTPAGAPETCARIAASLRWARRGVRLVRAARMSARGSTAGCRPGPRASP